MATITGTTNDDILSGTAGDDVIFGDELQLGSPKNETDFRLSFRADNGVYSPDGSKIAYSVVIADIMDFTLDDLFSYTSDMTAVVIQNTSTGQMQVLYMDQDGRIPQSTSLPIQFSPDGSKLYFSSNADQALAGDQLKTMDVFSYDLSDQSIERLSVSEQGYGFSWDILSADVSPDGTQIVFSGMLHPEAGLGAGWESIYIKSLIDGTLRLVGTNSSNEPANRPVRNASFSADGTKIVFQSDASNLVLGDTNGAMDVFVKDLLTGVVERVSTGANGEEANNQSTNARFHPDGQRVVFQTEANNLVEDDLSIYSDIYIKDLNSGNLQRITVTHDGREFAGFNPVFTPDGRYLKFDTGSNNIIDGGTSGAYLMDLETGKTVQISDWFSDVSFTGDSSKILYKFSTDPESSRFSGTSIYSQDIVESASADVLDGGDGNDEIHGGGGLDWLFGGAGRDMLHGGTETDALFGGDDDDQLMGEDGGDSLDGGAGNDLMLGGRGVDWARGGLGNDRIYGDEDGDALFGEDGDDQLFGGDGDDSLDGGDGRDELIGGAGVDWLYGGLGDDVLAGGADGDALFGEDGMDYLAGEDGDDSLDGGAGNDGLLGGAGVDWLFGQAGIDSLYGGDDGDVLFGGDDSDALYGEAGDDSLDGGDGNDLLDGGAGIDVLWGGAGLDEFRFAQVSDGGDVIRDFVSGVDRIGIDAVNFGFGYTGALQAGDFTSGAGLPSDLESGAGPKFYFETETRGLWFDPTGGTTEDIVIVAGLETGLVTADDIVLV
jgi:Ca2+-binding RTX toxin-like protein